jgi:hypothetical protein
MWLLAIEEKQALAAGFSEEKYPDNPVEPGVYPRTLHHPGFPIEIPGQSRRATGREPNLAGSMRRPVQGPPWQ